MVAYASISESAWQTFLLITRYREVPKGTMLCSVGELPQYFSYLYQGLVRCFVCDEKGNEYNKNFFDEDKFPGSMTSLLTAMPSKVGFEALEPCIIIDINFASFRQLIEQYDDFKRFQINYLEKNWLLAKDAREIEIVQQDASQRYQKFVERFPMLSTRIPQYHIASHLGITPTQLSRIRKKLL